MNYRESMEEDDMVKSRVGNTLSTKREEPIRRTKGLQARGIFKEVPRPSRGLALATAKRSLTLPPPWLGLAPSPYPNRLTMYKKMSIVEALLVHGKQEKRPVKSSQPSSLDKTSTYGQNPVGKKALFRKEKSVCLVVTINHI